MGSKLFVILMLYLLTGINFVAAHFWYTKKYSVKEPYFLLGSLIMLIMVFVSLLYKKNRTKMAEIVCAVMHFIFCIGFCFVLSPLWALIWLTEAYIVLAIVLLYFKKKSRHNHTHKHKHKDSGSSSSSSNSSSTQK